MTRCYDLVSLSPDVIGVPARLSTSELAYELDPSLASSKSRAAVKYRLTVTFDLPQAESLPVLADSGGRALFDRLSVTVARRITIKQAGPKQCKPFIGPSLCLTQQLTKGYSRFRRRGASKLEWQTEGVVNVPRLVLQSLDACNVGVS